ncbi:MAG: PAS domain S-box protein, partial [Bacteroidales bacterium]|nr:PAS domain S-box protein [Bacteroidales bacterium]
EEEEEEVRRFFQFFRKPEKVEDLNAQDTIRNRELTYKTKDGRLIPMLFNASIVFDDMGDVTSVVAGAKDITDIKRAEAVIKKERNFSANVIATVPDSLVVVDKDLRIKSANRSFYEIFQMEPENVIGASITEILGDKDGELSTVLLNLFGTEDILDGFELQYQSKRSGLPREVRSLTSQGKMILNVIARTIIFAEEEDEEEELIVLQDITSRKQAEETLRRFNEELELKVKERTAELTKTYNELRESKQKLLKAQQVARIGFVDVNLKTNECYWSDEIYRLFGVNPDKIKPSFESTNQFTHPDDLDFVMKEIGSAIQGIKELDVDHRILRFDGKVLWVHQQAELIRDADGNPDRIIGTLHDITERKRAEEELIKAKEKAEESNRLKSAFLANISHEIRTPMNGILGFAGLLKEPNLSGEMQEEFISLIEKSGERMLNIINDIVSISKIESGIIEIHLSETNVNKQLEFVYNLMKLNAESKRLKLSFTNSLTDKEAIIKTDSDKFNGIVINLVKNAIKYTDVGEIVFGYNKKGEYLEFYVKDTGIGIPNDRQEAIFERFIQADITDKMARQGAGLGLSISKAYVDMLGGKIWVVSEVGKGSTFYFTIPYQTETEENIAIKNEVLPSIEITLGNKLKILIVEDDETSGMLLSKMIDKYSKEILIAKTGIGAIETCRNNHDIDLILMDIRMSDLDGYVATRKIREFNTKVIIIAQTACALIGDSEKAIKAGCNDYITKPIIKAELQSLIQKYFKK